MSESVTGVLKKEVTVSHKELILKIFSEKGKLRRQIISISLKIYYRAHSWMINKIKCAFEVAETFWTKVFFSN